jgi:HEAT repeat protein
LAALFRVAPTVDKRANAIQALGLAAGDPAAVRLAEDALGDKEAYVRAAAVKALGALGSTESIPKLQNLVNDNNGDHRMR